MPSDSLMLWKCLPQYSEVLRWRTPSQRTTSGQQLEVQVTQPRRILEWFTAMTDLAIGNKSTPFYCTDYTTQTVGARHGSRTSIRPMVLSISPRPKIITPIVKSTKPATKSINHLSSLQNRRNGSDWRRPVIIPTHIKNYYRTLFLFPFRTALLQRYLSTKSHFPGSPLLKGKKTKHQQLQLSIRNEP